jgi:phospholipid-translocating ATPase
MVISQFFDSLKVGLLFGYVSPLAFVLVVTLIKEAFDDIYRYKQDRKTNSEKYQKITSKGYVEVMSEDIRIGDLIELNQNERIPADMIVIKTLDDHGSLFVRTDQLDGETDWKLRKAPGLTQKVQLDELTSIQGFIQIDPPNKMIYEFKGVLRVGDGADNLHKEPLGLENTMWASTVLASKKVIGMVIYTGLETRSKLNSSRPKMKVGALDLELNLLSKILFFIMLLSAFIITALKGFNVNVLQTLITYFRFVVLLCCIIPISLRINLDLSKAVNSSQISKDKNIPETIVRNSTIPEELGRINYIFSDKTGTLTKNEMIFKQLSLEVDQFTHENLDNLKQIIQHECSKTDAPLLDVYRTHTDDNSKRIRRNRDKVIRDAVSAMTLCNNVTPIFDDNGEITYQASSPDEVALVKTAEGLNMRLISRTDKHIQIRNAVDTIEEYEILAIFPFSSETKRMGILLKNLIHGHIIFYLKGAENIMLKFVKDEYTGFIKENAENIASIGLRTLVLTQKLVPNDFYEKWLEEYKEALTSMGDRKKEVADVISKLENNMEFLVVTGVEGRFNFTIDLLQDNVKDTIESLRSAGINIWMLTGDKVETAICIAISTGIKNRKQNFFVIRDRSSEPEYVKKELEELLHACDTVLIIDGDCLEVALNQHEKLFFEASMKVRFN